MEELQPQLGYVELRQKQIWKLDEQSFEFVLTLYNIHSVATWRRWHNDKKLWLGQSLATEYTWRSRSWRWHSAADPAPENNTQGFGEQMHSSNEATQRCPQRHASPTSKYQLFERHERQYHVHGFRRCMSNHIYLFSGWSLLKSQLKKLFTFLQNNRLRFFKIKKFTREVDKKFSVAYYLSLVQINDEFHSEKSIRCDINK